MYRKKILKKCIPLLMSFALLFGTVPAAMADTYEVRTDTTDRRTDTSDVQSDISEVRAEPEQVIYTVDPATGAAILPIDIEGQTEVASDEKDSAGSESVKKDSAGKEPAQADSPETGIELENEESIDVTETDEKTSFMQVLEKGDLVIVTIEESDPAASADTSSPETASVEKIGDLGEEELTALEEYVEDQGFEVTREAMLAAASATSVRTIRFSMNGFVSYAAEGYGSGYDALFYLDKANYMGNGNAYCIDPSVQSPGHDSQGVKISYTTTVRDYQDSLLVKIMYYGFGGPEDITASYGSTPTARHILTHMAATRRTKELGIPGAGDYTYRANATAISLANQLYNAINAKPAITGTVSVLQPVAGQQSIMLLASYKPVEEKGTLKLTKTSAMVSVSSGNPNYSLEGAEYSVYKDAELTRKVGSFTTDSNGKAKEPLSLKPGTYYIREKYAPKGYQLDPTVYTATVKADETTRVYTSDQPIGDPLSLLIEKIDADTLQAGPALQDAEFTVKFYPVAAGDSDTDSEIAEEDAGSGQTGVQLTDPQKTWVFRTDEEGRVLLQDSYKISGNSLFRDADGNPILPLGYITIQETKAPVGYEIDDTVYTCSTSLADGTATTRNLPIGENAIRERKRSAKLIVRKIVSGSGGNRNQEFHFTLRLTGEDGAETPDTIFYRRGTFDPETGESYGTGTTDEADDSKDSITEILARSPDGTFSFTLQHGEELVFPDLLQGMDYSIVETDGEEQGYLVTVENSDGTLSEEETYVTFRNDKEMIIPTGAHTEKDSTELQLMIFVLLAGLFTIGWFRKISRQK